MTEKEKPKKSASRKALNWAFAAVMIVLVAALAFLIVSNMQGRITFIAGKTVVWVRTESMEPVIPARSYILVEKADPAKLAVGDVILFYSDDPSLNGALNTHRIIEIDEAGEFVTRGDHNVKEDDYTAKPDKVVGVYRKNLPVLTQVGRFLSTRGGIAVMALVILAVTAAVYVPDLARAAKKKKSEEKKDEIDERVRAEVERLKAEAAENAGNAGKPDGEDAPATSAQKDEDA